MKIFLLNFKIILDVILRWNIIVSLKDFDVIDSSFTNILPWDNYCMKKYTLFGAPICGICDNWDRFLEALRACILFPSLHIEWSFRMHENWSDIFFFIKASLLFTHLIILSYTGRRCQGTFICIHVVMAGSGVKTLLFLFNHWVL